MSKDFSETVGYLLHSLVCRMEKNAHDFIEKEFDISFHQFLILMHIQERPEINQKQISQFMTYTEAAISRQMTNLRDKGLIQILENKSKRRENLLELTKNGQELIQNCIKLINKNTNELFSILNDSEQENFKNSILKLTNSLTH